MADTPDTPKLPTEGNQVLENDRHEMFCHEYLVDLNGTKSYMRVFPDASYDGARREASKLKAIPHIRARIQYLMALRSSSVLVDAGYVLESLIYLAEKCQVAEPVMIFDYSTKQMVETGEYQFDSNGANRALELIGKHLGMFVNKVDLTSNGDKLTMTPTIMLPDGTKVEI